MPRHIFCALIALATILFTFATPAFAQKKGTSAEFGISKAKAKKAQPILSKKIKAEIKKNLGAKGMKALRKAKTQKQLVAALKVAAKQCAKCTTTKKLVKQLKSGANGGSTKSVQAFWGDNDENGCGWANCLSRWGGHFPCKGMPGDKQPAPKPKPEPKEPDDDGEGRTPCDPNTETCPEPN